MHMSLITVPPLTCATERGHTLAGFRILARRVHDGTGGQACLVWLTGKLTSGKQEAGGGR